MRKSLLYILLVLLLIPPALGARSLFEMGLGISGIYDTNDSVDMERFLEGMANGENWTLGVGLNTRLSILDVSFLAMLPSGSIAGEQAMSLLSGIALQIPLVTDALYVGVGGGLTTIFSYAEGETEARIAGRAVSEVTFGDVVVESPLHLRFGLDVLIGSAKVGFFYLVDTEATIGGFQEAGGWADLFQSTGNDKVGMMMQLALF